PVDRNGKGIIHGGGPEPAAHMPADIDASPAEGGGRNDRWRLVRRDRVVGGGGGRGGGHRARGSGGRLRLPRLGFPRLEAAYAIAQCRIFLLEGLQALEHVIQLCGARGRGQARPRKKGSRQRNEQRFHDEPPRSFSTSALTLPTQRLTSQAGKGR